MEDNKDKELELENDLDSIDETNSNNEEIEANDDKNEFDVPIEEIENDLEVSTNNIENIDDQNNIDESEDEETDDEADDEADDENDYYEDTEEDSIDDNLPSENKEKIEALLLENSNLKNQIDVLNAKIDNLESRFMANDAKVIEDANSYYHEKLINYQKRNPRGATKLALYARVISIVSFIVSLLLLVGFAALILFKNSGNQEIFNTLQTVLSYFNYGIIGLSSLAIIFAIFGIIFGKRKGVAITAIIFAVFAISVIIIQFTPIKDSIPNIG